MLRQASRVVVIRDELSLVAFWQARRVVLSDVELNCVAVWFSRLGKLCCAESR